jgi:hypothetical protein
MGIKKYNDLYVVYRSLKRKVAEGDAFPPDTPWRCPPGQVCAARHIVPMYFRECSEQSPHWSGVASSGYAFLAMTEKFLLTRQNSQTVNVITQNFKGIFDGFCAGHIHACGFLLSYFFAGFAISPTTALYKLSAFNSLSE